MPIKRFFRKLTELIYGDINEPNNELEKYIFANNENNNISSNNIEDKVNHCPLYEPPSENNVGPEYNTTNIDSQSQMKIDDCSSDLNDEKAEDIIKNELVSSSLLLNEESLLCDLAEIVSEMDSVKLRLNSKESKEIIEFCQDRIIECMKKQQLDSCGHESVFNAEIHTPVPFQIVPNGTAIIKCLRPGLTFNGKLLLKALVTVS